VGLAEGGWGDCKGGIGAPPLPLGEAETEEETGADNVEPFPEHQPQVAAEAVGQGGRWHWRCGVGPLSGFSSEPLLDACRELARIGVPPTAEVGLFRPDYQNWDLKTTVGYGASQRVRDADERERTKQASVW
jgi:hypothetical protein